MNDFSYKEWLKHTDQSLTEMIGQFIRHNRLAQNLSQKEVAHAAQISRSTLSLLERGESVSLTTLIQVLRVLNLLDALEVFKIENTISPLALAKLQQEKRQRAGSSKKKNTKNDDSEW